MAINLERCIIARPPRRIGFEDRFFPHDPTIGDPIGDPTGNSLPRAPSAPRYLNRTARFQVCLVVALSAVTCLGAGLATCHLIGALEAAGSERLVLMLQASPVYGLFYLLVGGNLAYQCAQYGCIRRMAQSEIQPERPFVASDSALYGPGRRKKLLVLVPSYKERPDVVRQTLLSAALAEYPGRRIVLLIDDPPEPTSQEAAQNLSACRAIILQLQVLFDAEADRIDTALDASSGDPPALEDLAELYGSVADWLDGLAEQFAPDAGVFSTHTDDLFRERILRAPARAHRAHASALRRHPPERHALGREARRLRALLRVEFSSFERKGYANLSHAPNKAMNLNSYIGLLGGGFRTLNQSDGLHLLACDPAEATWQVPAADYIVTVDADSLITTDYPLRLVGLMEQPGQERVAVAQTPYTAVPGAPAPLERAAGASTDSQFFTHQGMAFLDASFWVGASALMRHAALLDIARTAPERGHRVKIFIDDRIQIEDSAATVDLLAKDWRVLHAPGRLTYSATPADFGALIIQRQRWANGGLLILPRLLAQALRRPLSLRRIGDALLRSNNLISAAIAGVGLPLLLLCPFDDRLVPVWMPLMVLPYYLLLGWDLTRAGYRWPDLASVYALTILLIPANFAGTLLSLRQALGGRAIPFCRTPKILGRTRTPRLYVAACYAIVLLALLRAGEDALAGRYVHLLYGLLIGLGALYGIFRLMGFRASWDDLRAGRPRGVASGAVIRGGKWRLAWTTRRAPPAPRVELGGTQNW